MITRILRQLLPMALLCLLGGGVSSQVKTKIFDKEIPVAIKPAALAAKAISIEAPAGFAGKKAGKDQKAEIEYSNVFALRKTVDIDFIKTATQTRKNGFVFYAMELTTREALNVSFHFNQFYLSPNAILSIFTDHEITEAITANENNKTSTWSTRLYQGDHVTLHLKVPQQETGLTQLLIDRVNFGFQSAGAEYFGQPGSSASCNINVLCPQGNGWNIERQSVAQILTEGDSYCTGVLVMNTCGTNIPYLLSAKHNYDARPRLQDWVFQFNYWSPACTSTTAGREDLQFNGCTLKADYDPSDFLLVELSQVPPAGSSIAYSGWNRSANPAANTTCIHHPVYDVMKIAKDFSPPADVSFQGGPADHWRALFDEGIVQPGSSGAPLYDENHRAVGQLHGNQFNTCYVGNDNCWCNQQIPSAGEFGRFDVSWTGGGQNINRLSNWLDPGNSGATTTNSTFLSGLTNAFLNLGIQGPSMVCTGSSVFTLTGAPIGATVTWTISDPLLATITPNGQQVNITATGPAGEVTLTATVNGGCYRNNTKAITIRVGGSYNNDFTITPEGNNNCYQLFSLYDLNATGPEGASNYNVNWEWSYLKESTTIPTSWQTLSCYSPSPICQLSLYEEGNYQIRLIATDVCGIEHVIVKNITVSGSCGGGWFKIATQPNPVNNQLTVKWNSINTSKLKDSRAVLKIVDQSGVVFHTQQVIVNDINSIVIDTRRLQPGNYFIVLETSSGINSKQFIKIK